MELIPVDSTAIAGYNYANGTFYYRYRSSEKVYDVPWSQAKYEQFLAAESKGRFIAQHVPRQPKGMGH